MKTLFITPQVPWPPDSGFKIRVVNLLRCYAAVGEVTLVCFAQDKSEAENALEVERYCGRMFCFPFDAERKGERRRNLRLAALVRAMQPRPYIATYFSRPELANRVAALLRGEDFDIVHVERLSMIQNVCNVLSEKSPRRRAYRVLDVDDLESGKMRRIAKLDPWTSVRKYSRLLEWLKLRMYERRALLLFDCALVCSEQDRLRLQRDGSSPVVRVFSNGADSEVSTRLDRSLHDGRTLVYFGAMGYPPNEDAVLYFAESVLPLVRRQIPDVRLVIAGKAPSPRVLALANAHDVLVTGYIQDKNALFSSCTVFIVPLRSGGGTRIKILEAMAFASPVVSTSIGCEGIDVTPGENIIVADAPEDFANACIRLLSDESRREALGQAGKRLVLRKYRWERIRRHYVESLAERVCGTSPLTSRHHEVAPVTGPGESM